MITKKLHRILIWILTCMLSISLAACQESPSTTTDGARASATESAQTNASENTQTDVTDNDTEWAIYLYLCGSDLETNSSAATNDLTELMDVKLPDNVKIIIETGGAKSWQNDLISSDSLGRYVYDSEGLTLIETQPLASMGSQDTLSSFLAFAKINYPAKKTGFIFWNHGGGSVAGAAFDENFDSDSLTLAEMQLAFADNYDLSEENPPFELIGFDTCLMATIDTASTFSSIGKYLVASQELEPGNGWLYSGWADALGKNPSMNGSELGKVICDTFKEGCEAVGTENDITLSVTNLSKINELISAYDDFGKEALAYACADPAFFSDFSRIAVATENFGGNTKEQGYTNMADLGDLARKSAGMLSDTSENVQSALENCVEYKVNGPYRTESTGLSCYYSYNGDLDDLNGYITEGVGDAFKYFYAYGLTGTLNDEGMNYIANMNYTSLPALETLKSQGWDNHALDVDSEGAATLTLGPKAADVLSGIYIELYYIDPENDMMLQLGTDNDLIADWDNGVFKDNFRNVWGALNGNLVYMELAYEGDGYNLYTVPILLDGEDYNLLVTYDFGNAAYQIQGARKAIDENGMADKNLRYFVDGDVITTIHYATTISGEDETLSPYEAATITVEGDLSFTEEPLGDGTFLQIFEMRDMQGNTVNSDVIQFDVVNGEITTTVGFTD